MGEQFTEKAQNALHEAQLFAGEFGHSYIGSEHLLLGLTTGDTVSSRLMREKGLETDTVRDAVIRVAGMGSPSSVSASDMTPGLKKIITEAASEATKNKVEKIGTEHLLLALLEQRECVAVRILESTGASAAELRGDVLSFLSALPHISAIREERESAGKEPSGIRAYGRDLTELARNGKIDPVIGRDKETEQVIRILTRKTKNNPCLIGEPGVGKTAVVEGLAQRVSSGQVPELLKGTRIYSLDLSGMIAGAKYRGEFEERFRDVIKEASENPDVILFIDEIHTIVGAGAAEGAVDAANIIKPSLARGELRVIGATTVTEYRKHIESDAALERRFRAVTVEEPTPEQAREILFGLRDNYEAHHGVRITDGAVRASVELSKRYLQDRFLPDKALDLLDEAASSVRLQSGKQTELLTRMRQEQEKIVLQKETAIGEQNFKAAAELRERELALEDEIETLFRSVSERDFSVPSVTEDDVAAVVTAWTGIPVSKLMEADSEQLLHLEEELKNYVVGQDAAVHAVAGAVRRGRSGLKDPGKPVGSFLFLGPSGVGKTELSKALAAILFKDKNALLRFDMSEYMERHSISRLIGSPPGYVGFGDGGQLTDRVRRRPYAVVLFDEIEKAHPDIYHIFLQILDDGSLTDSQGRRVDFSNTVMIMTSNAGSGYTSEKRLGFFEENVKDAEDKRREERQSKALKDLFRPELLNRFDEIVTFNTLGKVQLAQISRMALSELAERISSLGFVCQFTDEAVDLITSQATDAAYGARPIRRAVERMYADAISEKILSGALLPRGKVFLSASGTSPTVEIS